MGTNEWVAIGTIATALFTGFTAWLVWRNRQQPRITAELSALGFRLPDKGEVKVTFLFKNTGTGAAFDVRTFVTMPDLPDKQQGQTLASLAPGESVEFIRWHAAIDGAQDFNEETGSYPNTRLLFDPKEMGIAITWTQPPRHRRTRHQQWSESELLADYHRRYSPLG